MTTTAKPRPILGIVANHIQSIREAVTDSIAGLAIPDAGNDAVIEWLLAQGLEVPASPPSVLPPISILSIAVDEYRRKKLGDANFVNLAAVSSSQVSPDAKNIGQNRSGAGWSQGAEFCISSALVRLLGASEQFELDVLKALFYYRPDGGIGPFQEREPRTVDLDVIIEAPRVRDGVEYYKKPALWTWMKRHAIGNDERRKIFGRVFDLDLSPGQTQAEQGDHNRARAGWYNKRNEIAHGRAGVYITLSEYLDAEANVSRSVLHLAKQCEEKQLLII